MGWLSREYREKVTTEMIYNEIKESMAPYEVVKSFRKGNVVYSAIKTKNAEVIAMITLIFIKKIKDGRYEIYEFGTKHMDETMMPYYFDCPNSVLKLLTETENKNSLKWRNSCLVRREKEKVINKIENGDKIIFSNILSFGRHGEYRYFICLNKSKGHYMACDEDESPVMVVKLHPRNFMSESFFNIK